MRKLTITEALAELKTLDKRISKKREFVGNLLIRQEQFKDPHLADGGSAAVVSKERQSINDLENNIVVIRTSIQAVNLTTLVTVLGVTRSITEWLVWRKDVAPKQQQYLQAMRATIEKYRKEAQQKGWAAVPVGQEAKPFDIIVNVDEKALADEAEALENTLGTLDGLLSLKNATVTIEIP